MQRRIGGARIDLGDHTIVDDGRIDESIASVHHPVPDDIDRMPGDFTAQMLKRRRVSGKLALRIAYPRTLARDDARVSAQIDQLILNTRRTAVDNQYVHE